MQSFVIARPVAVAVVCMLLLAACSSDAADPDETAAAVDEDGASGDSIDRGGPEPEPPAEEPSDEPTVKSNTPDTGWSWNRVSYDEPAFSGNSQTMTAVTRGGPGLVAVGVVDASAAVWVSMDALTWERISPDEEVFGFGTRMDSVITGGPGLVAVGRDDVTGSAAVWVSEDGIGWERIPHDREAFGGAGLTGIQAVTEGGPGLVAVGWAGRSAAVWVSEDAKSWEPVPHDEAVFGSEGVSMQSVVAGGPAVIAAGYDAPRNAAAVWVSPDGIAWERVPHDDEVFGGTGLTGMLSLAQGGPGIVGVGHERRPTDSVMSGDMGVAAVWLSTDGLTWERVPHDPSVFGSDDELHEMYSVTVGGPGLVAVGIESGDIADRPDRPGVWVSSDGFAWEYGVDVRGESASMSSVIEDQEGLVAVGGIAGDVAIWVSRSW